MSWIFFAFLAPFLWAGCNVLDKFLLSKKFKNAFSYQVWIASMIIFPIVLLPIFFKISFNYPIFIFGIVIGIIDLISFFIYNKAMLIEEASRVIPLSYLNSIFVLPLSFIFLGETLTPIKYIAVLILMSGSILISYKGMEKKKRVFSPAIKFIILIAFFWASMAVAEKYILNFIDPISLLYSMIIGFFIGGIISLISKKIRKNYFEMIKIVDKKIFVLTILNIFLSYSAFFLFFNAISIGFVSLVVGISSIQPFIVFFYMTLLTLFFPEIIKEKIDKSTILLKLIAICFIFIGSYLIVS